MTFDWQEEWENAARAEYEQYSMATDKALISELKNQTWGLHYRIWDVIRDRGNPDMIKPLFGALKELKGSFLFLDRHHCVNAIFKLAKLDDQPLKERVIGPSNEFDEKAFEKSLRELKNNIAEYL